MRARPLLHATPLPHLTPISLLLHYTYPMQGYYTYPDKGKAVERTKRIAVVTQGVKLGDETRGYTRFRFLSELLAREGFEVDLITSTFQHWEKAQRNTTKACYQEQPYRIRFVYEPGYTRNLDIARIRSHHVFARNLKALLAGRFNDNPYAYDLIYSEIPPNNMARICAEIARSASVPFVVDINDLWPEAMRMAVDIPFVSDIAFAPFARDARRTYELISAAVGTSDEYAARPAADRNAPYEKRTVYVGNRLAEFDTGAQMRAIDVRKPANEFWVSYAGMLGASYDLSTFIDALVLVQDENPHIRGKILGDGPDRATLEEQARDQNAPVDFIGYAPYDLMAAYLCASDITVNSLVKTAAQSIVTKIGDYLAAGHPLINTGSSVEFRTKVETDGFGVNVAAEDARALADAILALYHNPEACAIMGKRGRSIAEEQFDQERSYRSIVELIRQLLETAQ